MEVLVSSRVLVFSKRGNVREFLQEKLIHQDQMCFLELLLRVGEYFYVTVLKLARMVKQLHRDGQEVVSRVGPG